MLNVLQGKNTNPFLTLPLHLHHFLDHPPPPQKARRETRKGHLHLNHLHQQQWVSHYLYNFSLRHNVLPGRELTLGIVKYFNNYFQKRSNFVLKVCFFFNNNQNFFSIGKSLQTAKYKLRIQRMDTKKLKIALWFEYLIIHMRVFDRNVYR